MALPTAPLGGIPFPDLSTHNENDQNQIDWPTLASYLLTIHPEAGAIIKMSQGDWYLNPYRHRQRWGAHAAGLKNVGLYHYVEMVSGSSGKNLTGAQNAEYFLKAIGDDGGIVSGEFGAFDWEDTSVSPTADLDAAALDCGDTFRRALGIAPLLYSGQWYAAPHNLERDPALATFPLWWASYLATLPPTPTPWSTISLWQFTASAKLPGVPFPVDISWWLTGMAALRAIQWGFQPDPLGGTLVAGKPDIAVNTSGEAIDATAAAQRIAANLATARRLYAARGTDLDNLLATTQGDAVAIALISGLQGA